MINRLSDNPAGAVLLSLCLRTCSEGTRSDAGTAKKIRRETETALVQHGYPNDALRSELAVNFTSDEEIEGGGERFYFFR